MKTAVEREVRDIEGVESVANELDIAGPASYTSRSNDALITTKVKASLVDMKTISATSFKVVTERGIVYLMGRVTQREGHGRDRRGARRGRRAESGQGVRIHFGSGAEAIATGPGASARQQLRRTVSPLGREQNDGAIMAPSLRYLV